MATTLNLIFFAKTTLENFFAFVDSVHAGSILQTWENEISPIKGSTG